MKRSSLLTLLSLVAIVVSAGFFSSVEKSSSKSDAYSVVVSASHSSSIKVVPFEAILNPEILIADAVHITPRVYAPVVAEKASKGFAAFTRGPPVTRAHLS